MRLVSHSRCQRLPQPTLCGWGRPAKQQDFHASPTADGYSVTDERVFLDVAVDYRRALPRVRKDSCRTGFGTRRRVFLWSIKDGLSPQWISDVGKKLKKTKKFDQAGVVPFRFRDGDIEFCLITSRNSGRWCFPKGIIDLGETSIETALKEAEEEAGLSGEICGKPLGSYEYSKWGRTLSVVVMLMKVRKAADQWEESQVRERRWVTLAKATELLDRQRLLDLVERAAERLEIAVGKS